MQVSEPLRVGGVVIEEVDFQSITDDQVGRFTAFANAIGAETHPEDPPVSIDLMATSLRHHPEFMRRKSFWASNDAGEVVASGTANWAIAEENQHIMRASIFVHADHRRRGIAKALLRLIVSVADSEGRTLLVGNTSDRIPAGDEFARSVGAELALEQAINRLVLADVDRELVDRWISEGPERAPGYSLISIDGDYPDDLVEAAMDVESVMNTAPRGSLDREDELWTVEQARDIERNMVATGTERWSIFARHDASGKLVGFTEVGWNAKAPETVWQWGTGVRPEHRGHALGKWMKATMLRRILDVRPSVDVRTGNADSNDAMLGINTQLGFKRFNADLLWQVNVERVRGYLDGSSV